MLGKAWIRPVLSVLFLPACSQVSLKTVHLFKVVLKSARRQRVALAELGQSAASLAKKTEELGLSHPAGCLWCLRHCLAKVRTRHPKKDERAQ